MKLGRYRTRGGAGRARGLGEGWGVVEEDGGIRPVWEADGVTPLRWWEAEEPLARVGEALGRSSARLGAGEGEWLAPVGGQEVWAAGVTYLRSKAARMEESAFSATAYDRVYEAERPELFFKALPGKVVGPGEAIGVRADSHWTVPEPELALVLSPRGRVVGCTIGNDVSARDIEGENLLYLPQAKVYRRSCALGPWVVLGNEEAVVRGWRIGMRIMRAGAEVFAGETEVGRLKRGFGELAGWLYRAQDFPGGAVLLTGTGVVPPDEFSLRAGDEVEVTVSGIGTLRNPVMAV